ncbi:MAG: Hpt domain-containing protein [Chitinophagaceae bacterium]|jgi:HPt (histidine-containing phosphotransfer) domain-containing protein|nr:Hpt domain-containing protein [Chitinophagaceae bacterium]
MGYDESFEGYEFSDSFDRQFLFDLYGDDCSAAEDIFGSSLIQIQEELASIMEKAAIGDVEGIRKTFHKIKPLFGYMGLLSIQDYVQEFEDRCRQPASMEDIRIPFENIMEIMREAIARVRQEHQKLKDFNNRRA